LKNQATTLLVELGTRLEPMAQEIGSGLSTLISGIKVSVDSGAFDPLFEFLDQVAGDLGTWIADIGKAFPEAMQNVDFDKLIQAFKNLGEAISEYFGGLDLTDVDDLSDALQTVIDVVTGLINITSGMADAFRPFITSIVEFVSAVSGSGEESQKAMGMVLGLATAIEALGLGIVAGIKFIDEYNLSITSLFQILAGGTQILWNGFQLLLQGIEGAFIIVEGVFLELIDTMTFGMFPGMENLKGSLEDVGKQLSTSIMQNGMDAGRGLDTLLTGFNNLVGGVDNTTTKTREFSTELGKVPKETKAGIILDHQEATTKLNTFKAAVDTATAPKTVTVGVQADGSTIEIADGIITQTFPDGRVLLTNAKVATDATNLSTEKGKIDTAIPNEKIMKIQADLDATRIKEQSEIIQAAIEWKAKFDIAELEANADKVVAIVGSIGESAKGATTVLSALFGNVKDLSEAGFWSYEIEQMIKDQVQIQTDALNLQKELTQAEIDYMNARVNAMNNGDALIQIDGTGLQPHLEAFMFEILSAIQVRATAEGQKFLVGL
jgi:hypothetical protein